MRAKITKTLVDSLTSPTTGQILYRDTELVGFAVRLTVGAKTYVAERKVNGRTVRVAIGQHGVFTPSEARERARQLLAQMSSGKNPHREKAHAKRRESAAQSAQVTLSEAYKAYVAVRSNVKGKELKSTTLADYKKCIDKHLVLWQDTPLRAITREMIADRHAELSRASAAQANMAMRFLRAVFNFAHEHYLDENEEPYIAANPVRVLSKKRLWNNVQPRTRFIRSDQFRSLFDAIVSLKQTRFAETADVASDYLITLLLTGLRANEGARLRCADVDIGAATLAVLDTKNRLDQVLPMGRYLCSRLAARMKFSKVVGSPWVFPAAVRAGHLTDPRNQLEAVREMSGLSFTLHDLRRTFASVVNHLEPHPGEYVVKRLLNHKSADITGRYVQHEVEWLRETMQRVEDRILTLADRQATLG